MPKKRTASPTEKLLVLIQLIRGALETGTEQGGQQQQTVTGYLQLRKPPNRLGIPDLALGHSEQRFLIAVIAFDLPAVHIGLSERLQVEVRVGADQKRRLAVQHLGTLA